MEVDPGLLGLDLGNHGRAHLSFAAGHVCQALLPLLGNRLAPADRGLLGRVVVEAHLLELVLAEGLVEARVGDAAEVLGVRAQQHLPQLGEVRVLLVLNCNGT